MGFGAPVHAQRLAIAEMAGDSDEAGAITLLLRSMIAPGKRALVSRAEWAEAAAHAPGTPDLTIEPDTAAQLAKVVGADRLVLGSVERGDGELTLSWRLVDSAGRTLLHKRVRAPRGEVTALALDSARPIAQACGDDLKAEIQGSLGELRPFVRAARSLADAKPMVAADALTLAEPTVAQRVSAAREVADALSQDPALAPEQRMQAALGAGETQAAIAIGEGVPRTTGTRAELARARLLLGDVRSAERELKPLKNEHATRVALARAQILYLKGKTIDCERELVALLDKTPPEPAALAFMAGVPPHVFSPALERLVVTAAQRVSITQPSVSAAIGLRALIGGTNAREVAALIHVEELDKTAVTKLSETVAAEKMPDDAPLAVQVRARSAVATVVTLPDGEPPQPVSSPATASSPRPASHPGSSGARAESKIDMGEVTLLVSALLETFAPLSEHLDETEEPPPGEARKPRVIVLAADAQSGESFWSWHAVNTGRAHLALRQALAAPPFHLDVVDARRPVADRSKVQLTRLAQEGGRAADFVLVWQLKATGGDARLSLTLFSPKSQMALEQVGDLPGELTGLARTNPLLWPFFFALAALLAIWGYVFIVRTGSVRVELKPDPGAEKPAVAILISRSEKPPAVPEPLAYHQAAHKRGPRRRGRTQHVAPLVTRFARIRPGKWWVHVYGTVEKGHDVRLLPEGTSQSVEVALGQQSVVKFDLDPNTSDYLVRITDGEPVAGARAWIDDDHEHAVESDQSGEARFSVARAKHTLHVEARDVKLARVMDVVSNKVIELNIDLVWERKQRSLAKGIEIAAHDESLKPELARSMPVRPPAARAGATDGTVAASGQAAKTAGERRYQRIDELGRGAMGVVFKGRDTVLERDVAIKLISEEVRKHPMALEMFFQEAKAMAALNHPNLVTVYDQGQDGEDTFVVMEFVDGETLEKMIQRRGALGVPETLEMADQIAAGLAYAHARRILHRDIKPANIFFTKDRIVKIGDFGLARAVREARLTSTKVCGTPMYMSPEQIYGANVDFRADLYSVGCTLFEMLTGRPPFIEGEVLYHHVHTPPPVPSSIDSRVPREVDKLILWLLEKDLSKRVSSAEHLRAAIKPLRGKFSSGGAVAYK